MEWPFTALQSLLFTLINIVVGILVNIVGVGGVLVVPAAAIILQCNTKLAISSALCSFVPGATANATSKIYTKVISHEEAAQVFLGAAIGACLSVFSLEFISSTAIQLLVGLVALFSGSWEIYKWKAIQTTQTPQQDDDNNKYIVKSRAESFFLGMFTGFGSGLSGTGGPILLLPVLLLRYSEVPVMNLVAIAQCASAALTIFSTVTNLVKGSDIEWHIVTLAVAGNMTGLPLGHIIGKRLAKKKGGIILLRIGVAGFLCLLGFYMALVVVVG